MENVKKKKETPLSKTIQETYVKKDSAHIAMDMECDAGTIFVFAAHAMQNEKEDKDQCCPESTEG